MDTKSQEKRTAIAILLSIVVIVVYNEVVIPKPEPVQTKQTEVVTEPQRTSRTAPPPPGTTAVTPAAPAPQAAPALPASQAPGGIPTREAYLSSQTFAVETDLYVATFTTLGGRLKSFHLKEHRTSLKDQSPLELVQVEDNVFPLGVYVGGLQDAATSYTIPEQGVTAGAELRGSTYSLPGSKDLSIALDGVLPNGTAIRKVLRFKANSYLFEVDVTLGTPAADGSPVWLEWTTHLDPNDESISWNPRQFVTLEPDSDISRVSVGSLEAPASQEVASQWTAFGGSYFQAVLLNQQSGVNTELGVFGNTYFIRSRGTPTGGNFSLLVGPKDREQLREVGRSLHRTVDLGWFAFIGDPILHGIHSLYRILGNYGLAIIALTLLLKTALLPLTKTSFKSMRAMQDLQPEIKALRDRIKDPTQLNQEVMKLYQKRGVNPLGGCFPMVLQMPIFLGMYNALQRDIDLRHAPFALWVNDLSAPEGLEILGITVPVMILLMGASMLFQQVTTPSAVDPAQKKAMYMVPVIFTVMFVLFPFPSGLVLYWLVNNIISIVQQMALRTESGLSSLKATLIGSVAVFIFSFILTLI